MWVTSVEEEKKRLDFLCSEALRNPPLGTDGVYYAHFVVESCPSLNALVLATPMLAWPSTQYNFTEVRHIRCINACGECLSAGRLGLRVGSQTK